MHQAGHLLLLLAAGKFPVHCVGQSPHIDNKQLVISFLASQYGPLHPTDKLNAPDIYIGIPTLLICIEMAFFAVMHIFAFSWRPYVKDRVHDDSLAAAYGHGTPTKYLGGFLGIKAYLDAMNPWDFVKASARGFRWIFIGYRHRTKDPSYAQAGKVGAMDGYTGTLHDTELHTTVGSPVRPLAGPESVAEDDRTGLLQHPNTLAQTQSQHPYPYRSEPEAGWPFSNASQSDLSSQSVHAYGKHQDYGPIYHTRRESGSTHPAFRPQAGPQAHNPQWEVFAGAGRPDGGYSSNKPGFHSDDYPARI